MDLLSLKDPREFIRAALNQGSEPISIRKLSQKLGYSSDRSLGMALKGQRVMSEETQTRIARYLKLTLKERSHLQSLVRAQKGVDTIEATGHKHTNASAKVIPGQDLHPLIPHYSFALLDILRIKDRLLSASELCASLRDKVPLEEVERTLEGLVHARFLRSEPNGYYRILREEEYIESPADVPSNTIRAIHRAQLARAQDVLEAESVLDREFIAKTLVIPREQVSVIKRLIREKLEELATEIAQETVTSDSVVAQLNMQFYLQSE